MSSTRTAQLAAALTSNTPHAQVRRQLKTRKPTGVVPWPRILVEGGEKAGKSFTTALLSRSDKIGTMYWIDLGEPVADQYGAIDGVDYEIVEHDGTWRDLLDQTRNITDLADIEQKAGRPPIVLTVDGMSAVRDKHHRWANMRARSTRKNRAILANDPNAEIKVPPNIWNDVHDMYKELMALFIRFPGIVILTARGKEVHVFDEVGNPVRGQKTYKVEAHKELAFDVDVWVRMDREHDPVIVGAKSVYAGTRFNRRELNPIKDFSLEWLIFDLLQCKTTVSAPPKFVDLDEPVEEPSELRAPEPVTPNGSQDSEDSSSASKALSSD